MSIKQENSGGHKTVYVP